MSSSSLKRALKLSQYPLLVIDQDVESEPASTVAPSQKTEDEIIEADADAAFFSPQYNLVYADPPWEFQTYSDKGKDRDPSNHYPTLTDEEIASFELGVGAPLTECIADDALLFLWCTPANLLRALRIMEAWGFEYRTHMVWVKDRVGTGYYARQMHEPLLIGRRGNPPLPMYAPPSALEAPRSEHSVKPAIFREALEKMYSEWGEHNRIELFAREATPGWTVDGYEAPN